MTPIDTLRVSIDTFDVANPFCKNETAMSDIVRKEKKEVARGSVSLKKWLTYTGIFAGVVFVASASDLSAGLVNDIMTEAKKNTTTIGKEFWQWQLVASVGLPCIFELVRWGVSKGKTSILEHVPNAIYEGVVVAAVFQIIAWFLPDITAAPK